MSGDGILGSRTAGGGGGGSGGVRGGGASQSKGKGKSGSSEGGEPVLVHASDSIRIYRTAVPRRQLSEEVAAAGAFRSAAQQASSSSSSASTSSSSTSSSTSSSSSSSSSDEDEMVTVAIKTLASPANPSAEDLSCLHNEYNILSRHLSDCPAARRAIKTERRPPAEGGPAVYLEWAHGETLERWMDGRGPPPPAPPSLPAGGLASGSQRPMGGRNVRVPTPRFYRRGRSARGLGKGGGGGEEDGDGNGGRRGGDDERDSEHSDSTASTADADDRSEETSPEEREWRDDLLLRCRVARGLAEALAQIHEAGVVHNDIFADNIVIRFEKRRHGRSGQGGGGSGKNPKRISSKSSQETTKLSNKKRRGNSNGSSGNAYDYNHDDEEVKILIIDFGFASLAVGNDLTDYDLNDGPESLDAMAVEVAMDDDPEGGSCNDDIYGLGNVLRDLFLGKGGQIAMRNSAHHTSHQHASNRPLVVPSDPTAAGMRNTALRMTIAAPPTTASTTQSSSATPRHHGSGGNRGEGARRHSHDSPGEIHGALRSSADSLTLTKRSSLASSLRSSSRGSGHGSSLLSNSGVGGVVNLRTSVASAASSGGSSSSHRSRSLPHERRTSVDERSELEMRRLSSFILADELGVPTYHPTVDYESARSGLNAADSDGDLGKGGDGEDGDDGEGGGVEVVASKKDSGHSRANAAVSSQRPQPSQVPQSVADLVSNLMISTGGSATAFGAACAAGHCAGNHARGGGGSSHAATSLGLGFDTLTGSGHTRCNHHHHCQGGELAPISVVSDPYRSARELTEDLEQMLADPDMFLFDPDPTAPPPERIEVPEGRLYGKDREMDQLVESHARAVEGGRAECVLVSGAAGAGKSTLIRMLRTPVTKRGGYYVSGKFDQLRGDEPFSALISAFSEFCDVVLNKKSPDVAEEMGRAVRRAVGDQDGLLTELFPKVKDILAAGERAGGGPEAEENGSSDHSSNKRRSSADLSDCIPELAELLKEPANSQEERPQFESTGSSFVSTASSNAPRRAKKRRSSDFLQNRMQRTFRMFVRAISTPDHPVVLVLDDLQWADAASLDLVKSLVTDPDNSSFLFVGSYRDNEVPADHPLQSFLSEAEKAEREFKSGGGGGEGGDGASGSSAAESGIGRVTRIPVGNLDLSAANTLVSESLRLTRRITRPLAELIHRKTHGNVLFFLQFLRSFRDEGILYYNAELRRWQWDLDRARTINPADNVAGLLADKIRGLPKESREVVKLAACLGSYFDGGTLRRLVDDSRRSSRSLGKEEEGGANMLDAPGGLERVMRSLIVEGVMDRVPDGGGGPSARRFKFSHDRIQQAAYSLVPEEERGRLHLRIGNLILRAVQGGGVEPSASALSVSSATVAAGAAVAVATASAGSPLLFTAVDQLNRGADLLDTEAERIEVAALNLQAGERAIASSAFGPAAAYLRRGVNLLGVDSLERCWSDHYDLSLRLFCNLAESEYCNCQFQKVDAIAGEILDRSRTVDDAMPGYWALMKSHGARGNNAKAANLGFDVLEKLGVKFPRSNVSKAHVLKDIAKTKLALRGKSEEYLKNLPAMTDCVKVSAMQVLTSMFAYAHHVKPEYALLVANKMVRLSLAHGATDESAFGFASYGCILCNMGEFKAGCRYANLALALLHRFDAKDWIAHVYALAHSTVLFWQVDLRDTLDPFLYSCRMGLEAGDNEYAMYSVMDYCIHSFYCGRPLEPLEEEMKTYCYQMVEYGQDGIHSLTVPYWQTILNLMGCNSDQQDGGDLTRLTGDAMDQDLLTKEAYAKSNFMSTSLINVNRFYLAYTVGNYDQARELSETLANLSDFTASMFVTFYVDFYLGLLSFALARECKSTKRKHWVKKGTKCLKKVKAWANVSPANWQHREYLLEAEHAAVVSGGGKAPDKAAAFFDRAINTANSNGFVHEEALAYERGGVFFAETGNEHMASRYFARSQELYLVWGAKAKAELVRTQYTSLVAQARRRRSFQVFKKRRWGNRVTANVGLTPNGGR